MPRHFLTGAELTPAELTALLDRAAELKAAPHASDALAGRSVALVFEMPSTRTRTSFEAGIAELGGHPMVLRPGELQLARGESVRDTALVLSRHVAAIALRTYSEESLAELARWSGVPVVNMLSPDSIARNGREGRDQHERGRSRADPHTAQPTIVSSAIAVSHTMSVRFTSRIALLSDSAAATSTPNARLRSAPAPAHASTASFTSKKCSEQFR